LLRDLSDLKIFYLWVSRSELVERKIGEDEDFFEEHMKINI